MMSMTFETVKAAGLFDDSYGGQVVDTYNNSSSLFGDYGGLVVDTYNNTDCCSDTNLVPLIGDSLVPVIYDNSYNGIYVTPTINYGYSTGYNNTYSGSSNWLSNYVNPYAGLYNRGGGSSGSGSTSGSSSNVNNSNSSVNNSGNAYDNSITNWYDNSLTHINNSSNYSFCNGNNNCNNTNTTIVSNSTNVNGNNNNVNTNANNTAPQLNCGAGYNPINGNCVQDIITTTPTPTYTPTPIYVNPSPIITNPIVYNPTPIYNNIYNSPNYTTPIYNNIYNTGYITPTYYNQTQYKTCNNNTTVPVWQSCYKYCNTTGANILETENCPINYNNSSYSNYGYVVSTNYINYPTVHITANPMIISAGESTQLSWAAANSSYCTASNGWAGSPVLIGNRTVNNLMRNMTFTITCYSSSGQSVSDTVSVIVNNNAPYNKAVTTIPNNITNNSAVCNGVGIVNTKVSTNGWFEVSEYDSNNNIIRTSNTNSANIGSNSSNYYSAPINGLKSNTKYSCLAVINNTYGIWKSEAMTFRTVNDNVKYISPMITINKNIKINKINKVSKVTNVKPVSIECVDTNGNKMSLENGQKLITLNINKVNSNIIRGETNSYTVSIKNISKVDIKDVNMQIAMDKALSMVDNNTFEAVSDNGNITYTKNIGVLNANQEKTFIIKVKTNDIINNNMSGVNNNSSAVTTVSASYIVSTTKGDMKDEVNVYSIDNITEPVKVGDGQNVISGDIKNIDLNKDDKVKSKTLGQIIDNMSATEWLATLAMIVIIGVLIRNIWMVYSEGKK